MSWSSVRGFEPFSLCDWPGHVSSVLFLGGCSMRCPTCHNADLAWVPECLPAVDKGDVMAHLKAHKHMLDGIAVTGGEPTEVQGLELFLESLRTVGLPIKLDSNGMQPQVIRRLLATGLVDAFAVDVKGPYDAYSALTGRRVTADQARANLGEIFHLAEEHPGVFLFRLTAVPSLTTEDIEIARGYLPLGHTLKLQAYRPPRRMHATADRETRRMSGNMVSGPHSTGDSQSAQGQRGERPAAVQATGA